MQKPDISIITVCLNAESTIRKTLDSVLYQSGCSIEYIIIDGGSTDGTLEILHEYSSKFTYFSSEKDAGIYDAMNKGISKATADLIGILNADDWYAPNAIERVVNIHRKHPNSVIHCSMMLVGSEGEEVKKLECPLTPTISGEFRKMSINHPATFVPRSIYLKYGVFDNRYKYSGDYDLMLRFLKNNVEFYPINYIVSYFRLGGRSGGVKTYYENSKIQLHFGRHKTKILFWFIFAIFKMSITKLRNIKLLIS